MSDTPESSIVIRRRRCWLRPALSLRAAMLLVLVAALGLGWMTSRARRQARAVTALQKLCAGIVFDYQIVDGELNDDARPPAPRWLRRLFGEDAFREVRWIYATNLKPEQIDAVIAEIEHVNTVDSITIFGAPSEAAITRLSRIPSLRSLTMSTIGSAPIPQPVARRIGMMTHLEHLDISEIAESDLVYLKPLKNLRKLRIGIPLNLAAGSRTRDSRSSPRPSGVTAGDGPDYSGLNSLRGMPNLEELTLVAGEVDLEPLDNLHQLRRLNLEFMDLPESAFVHIAGLQRLEELSLMADVSWRGMAQLIHMRSLRALKLSLIGTDTWTNTAIMEQVERLRQLEKLEVSEEYLDDDSLAHLEHMTNLRSLSLTITHLADDGLTYVKNLTNLRFIDVSGSEIGSEGLGYLERLPKLEKLNLLATRVDDSSIVHLINMRELREVELRGTKVTARGVERLRKARPGLRIWSHFD